MFAVAASFFHRLTKTTQGTTGTGYFFQDFIPSVDEGRLQGADTLPGLCTSPGLKHGLHT